MTHTLTLQAIKPVTHDTYHLTFDKPEGFEFTPGQATEMRLDRDGWRDEGRPFTFASLPDEPTLDFVIKTYPDHDGVTEQIPSLEPGDTVTIKDVWGAIQYKGDGVFIAGGAGVTPFIAILRDKLARDGALDGNTLVYSNTAERDIILRDTFEGMPGLTCHWTVTDQENSPLAHGKIDHSMLEQYVDPDATICYICGPDPMIDAVRDTLRDMGVAEDRIVTEDGH